LPDNITPPIVVDLGRVRKEQVDRLSRADAGPVADDIAEALRCIGANPLVAGAERVLVPVVVIYAPAFADEQDLD
jgi:hypothetical protein